MTGSIARRYAKAVLAIAKEEQRLDDTAGDLRRLATVAAEPEVGAALANPLLSPSTRQQLARTLAEQLALRPTMRNFVCLLADHRRLDQLAAIADYFQRLVDEALGRARATVTTAAALTADQERALGTTLERLTGKTVLLQSQVAAELLGGVVVEVEGTVYDGSLSTQLRRLATTIAGGRSDF